MQDFSLERLLGGIPVETFLREYWQKKPLLVRQALPGFGAWLDRESLSALACRDDAESRLVSHKRGHWQLERGPFEAEQLSALPSRGWSLLVSGVNHLLPEGDELLNRFDFIPRARLDDLMVSFAPKGGGVGPHFDSYDVFLIQGKGSRRWEISAQDDLEVADGAPLRILKRFTPDQSWQVEAGDLLYLPPHLAHNGVALEDCMTWSVGFKVPRVDEITYQFLTYLQDRPQRAGMFADPKRPLCKNPGEIPDDLLAWTVKVVNGIHWNEREIADFLGRYLSEPKPHIFFDPPRRPLSEAAFARAIARHGVRLSALSQLLFQGSHFYINGESVTAPAGTRRQLRQLADQRRLAASDCDSRLLTLLRSWYLAGYLLLN